MRINKAILPCAIALSAYLLTGLNQSIQAMSPEALNAKHGANPNVAKVKAVRAVKEIDNNGRQLALSIPGLGTANISVTPAAPPVPIKAPKTTRTKASNTRQAANSKNVSVNDNAWSYAISRKGNNITVKVPETVDEAVDCAHVASKTVGKLASESAGQVGNFANWIGKYIKQLTHSSSVTPAGYPYIQQSPPQPTQIASGHRLHLTTDGRLRSVVNR